MTTARAYVMRPDDAPAYWQIRNLWHIMATGIQTGGSFCAIDQINTDGGGPPTHYHTQDEGMYIINGHCSYNAAGEQLPAGSGTFIGIPKYVEHSFKVDAPGTQFLNFYLPAGFEMLLMGLAVPAERNELPTLEDKVPLPPRKLVEQLSRDYGAVPVIALPFADHPAPDNMVTKPTVASTVKPFIANLQTAPTYWYAGGLWSVLADAVSTDHSYTLFEQLMPRGPAAAPHLHEWMDEVFYILDGDADFLLGDRVENAIKGSMVFIPRGTVHGFGVNSETARFLNLYTPAGMERMVVGLGEHTEVRELPASDWSPPTMSDEHRALLFEDLGMRPVAVAETFKQ